MDITHKIPPQDIRKGALSLYFSYKYFPLWHNFSNYS
uniref:S-adenosyl-l-methionine hydroxide adenosyltransferase N-terminal domain-containing protein n=1 Tax=Thermodesulfobacterium geofontis TaxID=1295609 RepID=A0A7C4P137_9BACT